jgi:hypothetical protein
VKLQDYNTSVFVYHNVQKSCICFTIPHLALNTLGLVEMPFAKLAEQAGSRSLFADGGFAKRSFPTNTSKNFIITGT